MAQAHPNAIFSQLATDSVTTCLDIKTNHIDIYLDEVLKFYRNSLIALLN